MKTAKFIYSFTVFTLFLSSSVSANIISKYSLPGGKVGLAAIPSLKLEQDWTKPLGKQAKPVLDNSSQEPCQICHGDFNNKFRFMANLPCKHPYHDSCIRPWTQQEYIDKLEQKCPYCKKDINILTRSEKNELIFAKLQPIIDNGTEYFDAHNYKMFIEKMREIETFLQEYKITHSPLDEILENRYNMNELYRNTENIFINPLAVLYAEHYDRLEIEVARIKRINDENLNRIKIENYRQTARAGMYGIGLGAYMVGAGWLTCHIVLNWQHDSIFKRMVARAAPEIFAAASIHTIARVHLSVPQNKRRIVSAVGAFTGAALATYLIKNHA